MDRQFTNLDSEPELWYAFAGPVVQIPPANSLVYYFIQGHLEHCCIEALDMAALSFQVNPPSRILCRVDSVNYLADPATDQVLAKFRLTPLLNHQPIEPDNSLYHNPTRPPDQIKVYPEPIVRKILERNNKHPPQTSQFSMKYDLHGNSWFCERIPFKEEPHIGRSWNDLLNRKSVVEGDIILFMKDIRGDERFGVLRGKRRTYDNCYGLDLPTVVQAILSANRNMPFDVYYYPRVDTPEFVVKAARVEAAMQIQWQVGTRFSMQYEDERTSLLDTCSGTISFVEDVDHRNWPNSQWRRLQIVKEDAPQYEMRVNPWMLKPYLSVNATKFIARLQEARNVNRSI